MVNSLGKNLNVAILCDYSSHHGWMSFLLWYSISKNLPEAKVFIFCSRNIDIYDFYQWPKLCKIPFYYFSKNLNKNEINVFIQNKIKNPILILDPDYVCVRDFEESNLVDYFNEDKIYEQNDEICCSCKENKFLPFVSYKDGWGKFITSKWINKLDCPFRFGLKFDLNNGYFNESKISKMWNSASSLFQKIKG